MALEIAYLGWDFHGFASQADSENTIEVRTPQMRIRTLTLLACAMLTCSCNLSEAAVWHKGQVLRLSKANRRLDTPLQGHFFEALRRTRLIPEDADWHSLRYSRCGRTDKGVSALGQASACWTSHPADIIWIGSCWALHYSPANLVRACCDDGNSESDARAMAMSADASSMTEHWSCAAVEAPIQVDEPPVVQRQDLQGRCRVSIEFTLCAVVSWWRYS